MTGDSGRGRKSYDRSPACAVDANPEINIGSCEGTVQRPPAPEGGHCILPTEFRSKWLSLHPPDQVNNESYDQNGDEHATSYIHGYFLRVGVY